MVIAVVMVAVMVAVAAAAAAVVTIVSAILYFEALPLGAGHVCSC